MNKITAIVLFLLMSCPVYSREWRHGVRSITTLRATASTAATSSKLDENDADNESDDQQSETDNDSDMDTEDMDTDTDGTDGDQNMDTDDADTNDTNMNEDDDDDGDTMNSVKRAIRASLTASAMKQSKSSLDRFAAALNSGLSPRQTIKLMLAPPEPDFVPTASAVSKTGSADSVSGLAGGVALSTANGAIAVTASPGIGTLTAAAVPEPAAWILVMTGIWASIFTRWRPGRSVKAA